RTSMSRPSKHRVIISPPSKHPNANLRSRLTRDDTPREVGRQSVAGRSVLRLVPALLFRRSLEDGIERMPQHPRLARHVRHHTRLLQGPAEAPFQPVGDGGVEEEAGRASVNLVTP